MHKSKPWQITWKLAVAVAVLWLFFRFLWAVFLPFAIGLLPAIAANKAADRIQSRLHTPRRLTVLLLVGLLYISFFLVLFFLGRLLFQELTGFFRSLPSLAQSLTGPLSRLEDKLLRTAEKFPDGIGAALEQWTKNFFSSGSGVGDALYEKVFSFVTNLLRKAPDIGLFLLTTGLSGFMLAAELPDLSRLWQKKAPKLWQDRGQLVMEKLKGTLFCWLKAQGKLVLITFLILTAGFLILGIEYAFLFAVVIAMIDALPVLGSGLILIPWSLVQFMMGNTFRGVGLVCIYGAAALTRTTLEPRLIGKQMGLDPLLTLLAMYAGYRFFGVLGMIAFPMAAMFLKQIFD